MKDIDLKIEKVGAQGDGITSYNGAVAYVARALVGETVRVHGKRGRDGIIRADIQKIITSVPERQKPPCPHYNECGGCTFQHMKIAAYQCWKEQHVRSSLARKNINPQEWQTSIFVPEGTRRRASFSALKLNNSVIIGYHKRRSKMIVDITECCVLSPSIMALKRKLAKPLANILREGQVTNIFLQEIDGNVEMLITGNIGQKKNELDLATLEEISKIAQELDFARIGWRCRSKDIAEIIIQRKAMYVQMGALSVELPLGGFMQPSIEGQEALLKAVMSALPEKGCFVDLFSGSGTFAGVMLERGKVSAYEANGEAISFLTKAAKGTGLKVYQRDLFNEPLAVCELNKFDAIIFDPPRAGAKEQVKDIAHSNVPLVISVSCNPATFARDAHTLEEGGYYLDSLQIIDQFIYSYHVELVGIFRRKS